MTGEFVNLHLQTCNKNIQDIHQWGTYDEGGVEAVAWCSLLDLCFYFDRSVPSWNYVSRSEIRVDPFW